MHHSWLHRRVALPHRHGSSHADGTILRGGVSLGAGNLVTEGKDLAGGYMWMGRPARKVRELTEAEKACFEYTAKH